MSEYQYYEFVALDRPLTPAQMDELRAISTRAEITPARFRNEYQWGDLKADPARLVERYFDAHLYFANWGTRRLMLRLPKARVDVDALRPYFPGKHAACMKVAGDHVVLSLTSDIEEPEYGYDEESQGSLAALSPLRAELIRGDLRPAYLAWLLAVQAEDVGPRAAEPPVPAGLATLTAAQQTMADFLRIDEDLLAAAASGSARLAPSDDRFRRWVLGLPQGQKDRWLKRAAEEPELALGAEMLRAFRATETKETPGKRRTVADLDALFEEQREAREKGERAQEERDRQAAERHKQQRLDKLARDVSGAWQKLEELVATSDYDEAVKLALDLRDLATREGEPELFSARFDGLRRRRSTRRAFFQRWKRASEGAASE